MSAVVVGPRYTSAPLESVEDRSRGRDGPRIFILVFLHIYTFHLLDKPWSQVSSLLPPGSCLQFLLRIGLNNPTARFFTHIYFPSSGQAVVTGVVPSSPRLLPSFFIAHRVQQSHCSSILTRMLITHALAVPASQFVHEKKSPRNIRVCTRGEFI